MRTWGLGALSHDPRTDELAVAEYTALRATMAARGHLRFILVIGGLAAWAGTLLAVLIALPQPVLALVPLLLLIVVFEALRSLHAGVERIGRYVRVYFEDRCPEGGPPSWERAVPQIGGRLPGAAGHPLFMPIFLLATVLNQLAVALPGPMPEEWIVLGLLHAAFVVWMLYVDRGVRAQRAHDEARFREIRDGSSS
jgi:hypothetical protein